MLAVVNHYFVTATLKLKLKRNGPDKVRQQQFDVKKLTEPRAKSTFTLQLKKKFQALADAEKHTLPGTIIRITNTQTSEACLGYRQKKWKEWSTADT